METRNAQVKYVKTLLNTLGLINELKVLLMLKRCMATRGGAQLSKSCVTQRYTRRRRCGVRGRRGNGVRGRGVRDGVRGRGVRGRGVRGGDAYHATSHNF